MPHNISVQELEDIFGPVGFKEYEAASKTDKERIQSWVTFIRGMSDEDFIAEIISCSFGSHLVDNFRGEPEFMHARDWACRHEARRRHVASGHEEDCRGSSKLWFIAARRRGYSRIQMLPCTCGKE